MSEPVKPVVGEEAIRRMGARAMGQNIPSSGSDKNPLKEALEFKREMAADAIISAEVETAEAKATKAKKEAAGAGGGGESSGFQLKGGGTIDLGHIDFQAERQAAQSRLGELEKQLAESARETGRENAQFREKINEQQVKITELTLGAQIQQLSDTIAARGNPKTFMEQYQEAMETVKILGLQTPGSQTGSASEIQVQLKKLEFEHAVALRELDRADKAEQRHWDMELIRLNDERAYKKEELEIKRKQGEFWGQGFETIGRALAQGFMEGQGGGEGIAQVAPPTAKASAKASFHIDVPMGGSGETNCPDCGTEMFIGPTARKAICPKCGLEAIIKRISATAPGEAPPATPPDKTPSVEATTVEGAGEGEPEE